MHYIMKWQELFLGQNFICKKKEQIKHQLLFQHPMSHDDNNDDDAILLAKQNNKTLLSAELTTGRTLSCGKDKRNNMYDDDDGAM